MPYIKWAHIRAHPVDAIQIVVCSILSSIKEIIGFRASKDLSLSTALKRIWIGNTMKYILPALYSEPDNHNTQIIHTYEFATYVLPATEPSKLKDADVVMIYAHGGGLYMGHPLQYLDEYNRWVNSVATHGKRLVILAVEYPLSLKRKWPAQRDPLVALYSWLLEHGIQPSRIVIGGDSAGGLLTVATLLYLRDHTRLPQPSCAVLVSPWLDMSAAKTRYNGRAINDYYWTYDEHIVLQNDSVRPEGMSWESPEISPLLTHDVSKLPPQLIIWSTTELIASDSEDWVERCKNIGADLTTYPVPDELHTFAMGWPFIGKEKMLKYDSLILNYMLSHVG